MVRTSAIQLQYNYNKITQKFCCIAAVHIAQYNCDTRFLQLLQVACKFSASCRKLVLQHCIAGVHTSAIQLQYKKKVLVSQLYCSCIALVQTALPECSTLANNAFAITESKLVKQITDTVLSSTVFAKLRYVANISCSRIT